MKAEDFKDLFIRDGGAIYWKDRNFDIGRCFMPLWLKRVKAERAKLFERILFNLLDNINEEVYIVPHYYVGEDGYEDYYNWFEISWYKYTHEYRYKEIIKAANRDKIYLKGCSVIPYKGHRDLAIKFFYGNLSYLSLACFIIPALKIVIKPIYEVQLVLFGNNDEEYYKKIVEHILSKSDKLEYWIRKE